MTSAAIRVAIGRFYHESNRLNPLPATGDQFEIQRGAAVFDCSGSTLAGIVSYLQDRVSILPVLSVSGPPSGLIDHVFYQTISGEFLQKIAELKPDAIVLDLHGAAASTQLADLEGDFLMRLRQLVGPSVPIGIGLDLHAHLTDFMLANVDICIACKENPHSDVVECGGRAAALVLEVLEGKLRPVTTSVRVPMILPGAGETASGPLGEIHQKARRFVGISDNIVDISIYNVFRYADDTDIGQVVTVITNGEQPQALEIAKSLAGDFWSLRDRFKDDLLSVEDAFAMIRDDKDQRPYVMADMGDRILAGAPGDSTVLLAAVLEDFKSLTGALTITDPDNAARAIKAGIGAEITLSVGGQITPGFVPLNIRGKVVHVSEGSYVLAGPFHGGEASSLGASAVVLVDQRIYVLLTSKPAFSHDPAVFSSQGIILQDMEFVVVKSGYHFTMNFAGLATPLLVATPGVGYYRKGVFPYHKARFWPEHEIEVGEMTTTVHGPIQKKTASLRASSVSA